MKPGDAGLEGRQVVRMSRRKDEDGRIKQWVNGLFVSRVKSFTGPEIQVISSLKLQQLREVAASDSLFRCGVCRNPYSECQACATFHRYDQGRMIHSSHRMEANAWPETSPIVFNKLVDSKVGRNDEPRQHQRFHGWKIAQGVGKLPGILAGMECDRDYYSI